jgi:tetratricopeptide (TPR) repeat protein
MGSGPMGYAAPFNFVYQPAFTNLTLTAPAQARVRMVAAAAQIADDDGNDDNPLDNALDFAGQGEVDFRAGKYRAAIHDWRHALVDDPKNGAIMLLLAQALFATGQYDEAAGATQFALANLPEDKWGTVITHYKELYPNIGDYTTQLRALEKARDAKPKAPAIHFLLGYHFGYLNFPKHAVKELDKVLAVAPDDKIASKLREQFYAKLSDEEKAAADKQSEAEKKEAAKAKSDSDKQPAADKDDGAKGDKKDDASKDSDTKDGDKKDAPEAPGTDA